MCELFDQYERNGREVGKQEGLAVGRKEEIMIRKGRICRRRM